MNRPLLALLLLVTATCLAGDGADGPNRYEADFTNAPRQYQMTKDDERWTASLLRNLKEKGKVTYFTRTDLVIRRDGVQVEGAVYRCVSKPNFYYISEGDVMLDLSQDGIFNPGVGGFSMHSPKSRQFIACLNFQQGGVGFVRHSPIARGQIWWFANPQWKRLESQ